MARTLEMRLGEEKRVVEVDDGDVLLLGMGTGVETRELTGPNRKIIHLADRMGDVPFQDMVPDADYVTLPAARYRCVGLPGVMARASVAGVKSRNGVVVSKVSSELMLMVLGGKVHAGTTFDSQGIWGITGGETVPTYYGGITDLVEVNGSLYGGNGERIDLELRDRRRRLERDVRISYIDTEAEFVEVYGAPYLILFPNNNVGNKGNGLLGPIRLITPGHNVMVADSELGRTELSNLAALYKRAQREEKPDTSMDAALASSLKAFNRYRGETIRPTHSRNAGSIARRR